MITNDHYSDIKSWLKVINSNKKKSKIFYAENDDAFIVDGKLFKMLPAEYCKYSNYDEFYVHVNVKEKEVMYKAWNIENFDELKTSPIESGYFSWEKIEFVILTFITANISKLSYSVSTAMSNFDSTTSSKATSNSDNYGHTPYAHTPYIHKPYISQYNETDYKERDAAREKFAELIKQNKTGMAIDHADKFITKLCESKKFASLDMFVISLSVDAMNAPTMLAVLKATRGADHIMKDRKSFYDKVRIKLGQNSKKGKIAALLNEFEPGKEYAGIVKYNNDPIVENKANASN